MSYNKVILIGNLGSDPEVRYTASGTSVCNFSLATSERWTDKSGQRQEKTEWHRVSVFGKSAEACGEYLKKGSKALVEGRIGYRSWEDRDGNKRSSTEITANQVEFLSTPRDGAQRQRPTRDVSQGERYTHGQQPGIGGDDIPF